ncbi:hypothetical protein OAI_05685 [Vibrio cyclitrophicus FF160]|uniref:MobV family relaxase n=1 Tax=Vibrio cyclitrophicus TaxID=47951 RepID=UPI0002D6EC24|nr:MobV family relaxase [Vibrio cyclitrophicus]OEE83697.1 hypothetical protein OAI_05685 [Vibrio cyclitrophicus FF160]
MPTTILRFEKIKSFTAINLSESHVFRFSNTPNSDPKKTHLNRVIIGKSNISNRIKRVFSKFKIRPRKNAVLAMDCIMSLSNEAFVDNFDVENFIDSSINFLQDTFKGRCISAVIHLDETTPHIHAIILPLEKKSNIWKLNARDIFNKSTLSKYQKSYYSHMKSRFPKLTPPQYGSKAKHIDIRKSYHKINEFCNFKKNTQDRDRDRDRDRETLSIYQEVYKQQPTRMKFNFR